MQPSTRRSFLRATLAIGALAPTICAFATPLVWSDYPFTLGVASGYPRADGAVLWTRLAPQPLRVDGGVEVAVIPVQWEVAGDEHFKTVVAHGVAYAEADWAHSVHVEVSGLEPWRWYHYRFHCGDATSVSGRLRTAPRHSQSIDAVRFAAAVRVSGAVLTGANSSITVVATFTACRRARGRQDVWTIPS